MHSFFFQEFGSPFNQETQGADISTDPRYNHNVMVLEIANNFPHARWLMHRHKEGLLKSGDQLEKEWFNFLIQNKINILDYNKGEEDKFILDHFKKEI